MDNSNSNIGNTNSKKDNEKKKHDNSYLCLCGHVRKREDELSSMSDHTSSNYFCGFLNLYNVKDSADIVINLADKTSIFTHRTILSLWSSVFRTMLIEKNGMKDSKDGVIDFTAHDPKQARLFIKMIYYMPIIPCGILSLNGVCNLFKMAHMFGIPAMMKMCINLVTKELKILNAKSIHSSDDVLSIANVAGTAIKNWNFYDGEDQFKETSGMIRQVLQYATMLIVSKLHKIQETKEGLLELVKNLDVKAMDMILSHQGTHVKEMDMLVMLLQWIVYHYSPKFSSISLPRGDAQSDEKSSGEEGTDEQQQQQEEEYDENCYNELEDCVDASVNTLENNEASCFASDGENEKIIEPEYPVEKTVETDRIHIGEKALALVEKIRWGLISVNALRSINPVVNDGKLPRQFNDRIKNILLEAIMHKISKGNDTKYPCSTNDIPRDNQAVRKRRTKRMKLSNKKHTTNITPIGPMVYI